VHQRDASSSGTSRTSDVAVLHADLELFQALGVRHAHAATPAAPELKLTAESPCLPHGRSRRRAHRPRAETRQSVLDEPLRHRPTLSPGRTLNHNATQMRGDVKRPNFDFAFPLQWSWRAPDTASTPHSIPRRDGGFTSRVCWRRVLVSSPHGNNAANGTVYQSICRTRGHHTSHSHRLGGRTGR
jgi:hypothetical protein